MDDRHDNFSDVINKSTGIFDQGSASIAGSEGGLTDFERPSTVPQPDGVAVGMSCRGCGRPAELIIEYPELVAIKYNVAPHVAFAPQHIPPGIPAPIVEPVEWRYSTSQQAWFPIRLCQWCGTVCAPLISSDEATAHLVKAARNGWTRPDAEKQLSVIAYQVAQRLAQQAAQQYAR
jgi:hypothetical protein